MIFLNCLYKYSCPNLQPTVTTQEATNPPSTVVALTVAVPDPTPLTTPEPVTEATRLFVEDQRTDIFEAFAGATFANNARLPPRLIRKEVTFKLTPVTGVTTLMTAAADLPPSTVVARIDVEPFPTARMSPPTPTVATEGTELVQVTALLLAPAGATVATARKVDPTAILKFVTFNETDETLVVTVTVAVAVLPRPLQVIVVVPLPTPITPTPIVVVLPFPPFTVPLAGTAATLGFAEDHVTAFAASPGRFTDAFRFVVLPTVVVKVEGLSRITTGPVTVTIHDATFPPSVVVADTVAAPAETPVTSPL
jgi:hypothetical protein